MKVGSLVECVANNVVNPSWKGVIPEVGKLYTVRQINVFDIHNYLYVEEIISPKDERGDEYVHDVRWYREVQPPMDLSFIEELQFEETLNILKP